MWGKLALSLLSFKFTRISSFQTLYLLLSYHFSIYVAVVFSHWIISSPQREWGKRLRAVKGHAWSDHLEARSGQ